MTINQYGNINITDIPYTCAFISYMFPNIIQYMEICGNTRASN